MDINKIINEIVDKLKANPTLLNNFKENPVKTLETLSGIDLPDEKVGTVVAAVKVKLADGGMTTALGSLGDMLKK